jgi:5-methylcytosine-specific restriction endonuclease McrA
VQKARARERAHPGTDARRAFRLAHPGESKRIAKRIRRARKRGTANHLNEPVTAKHLAMLLEAQDACCRYCRRPLDGERHLEHRVPLARGGAHAPSNLCWSCPPCNLSKGTRTEAEFLAAHPL